MRENLISEKLLKRVQFEIFWMAIVYITASPVSTDHF